MPIFCVIDNNIVVNTIVAESLEIAQSIVDLEVVEAESPSIGINSPRIDGVLYPPKPQEDYVWYAEKWVSPENYSLAIAGDIAILTPAQEAEIIKNAKNVISGML